MNKESLEYKMSQEKVPTPNTIEELSSYISYLSYMTHDYGTAVYAMSMAAVATLNFMTNKIGASGFQYSCADMDILRRTRNLNHGFSIVDYSKVLYPQYRKDFLTYDGIIEQNRIHFASEARKLLDECSGSQEVQDHWTYLSSLATDTEVLDYRSKE